MVWPGTLVLFVGALLTFAVGGDITGAMRLSGVIAMVLGAVLLVAGITRLNRGRGRRVVDGMQDRAYRTSKGKMIAMILAVVYILSPIDIIPDFLLPIGVVDDATAFSWLVFAVGQEMSRRHRRAI